MKKAWSASRDGNISSHRLHHHRHRLGLFANRLWSEVTTMHCDSRSPTARCSGSVTTCSTSATVRSSSLSTLLSWEEGPTRSKPGASRRGHDSSLGDNARILVGVLRQDLMQDGQEAGVLGEGIWSWWYVASRTNCKIRILGFRRQQGEQMRVAAGSRVTKNELRGGYKL